MNKPTTTTESSPQDAEVGQLRLLHDQEASALTTLVEQVQQVNRALIGAQKRMRSAEVRQEAESARLLGETRSDRDRLGADLERARAEHAAAAAEVAVARDQLKALSAALAGLADPLEPRTDEDVTADWDAALDAVTATRSGRDPGDLPASFAAARDLVGVLAARITVQSKRVQMLRDHIVALEGDNEELTRIRQDLTAQVDSLSTDLAANVAALAEARASLAQGEEDRTQLSQKLTRHTTASLDSEAKAMAERERLASELHIAKELGDDLAKQRQELTTLLRRAERAGVDLVQVAVSVADGDLGAPAPVELPALQGLRDELAAMAADVANAMDDEVDGLFRQDLGDDLAQAARRTGEAIVARRRALASAIEAERALRQQAEKKIAEGAERLATEQSGHQATRAGLDKCQGQLDASRRELETRSHDLAERQKEVVELKSDVARMGSEIATLQDQLAKAREVRAELDRTQTELAASRKELTAAGDRARAHAEAQQQLARQLIELATAADAAMAANNLKGDSFISRFTKTVNRLEGEAGRGGDVLALVRSSTEVVDKLTARVAQLAAELARCHGEIAARRKDADGFEQKAAGLAKTVAERDAALRVLTDERDELARVAKRATQLDEKLAKTSNELAETAKALKAELTAGRSVRAELEELKARTLEDADARSRELADLKRRLADELKARRAAETATAREHDEATNALAAQAARTAQLERMVEERDHRIESIAGDAAGLTEARRKLHDLQARLETATRNSAAAQDRIRALEAQLLERDDDQGTTEALTAATRERDALAARLRAAEKRQAEELAQAGSVRTQNEALKRKLDEARLAHRAEQTAMQERLDQVLEENRRFKEKLAGLNARVKTLTAI